MIQVKPRFLVTFTLLTQCRGYWYFDTFKLEEIWPPKESIGIPFITGLSLSPLEWKVWKNQNWEIEKLEKWRMKKETQKLMLMCHFLFFIHWFSLIPSIFQIVSNIRYVDKYDQTLVVSRLNNNLINFWFRVPKFNSFTCGFDI